MKDIENKLKYICQQCFSPALLSMDIQFSINARAATQYILSGTIFTNTDAPLRHDILMLLQQKLNFTLSVDSNAELKGALHYIGGSKLHKGYTTNVSFVITQTENFEQQINEVLILLRVLGD